MKASNANALLVEYATYRRRLAVSRQPSVWENRLDALEDRLLRHTQLRATAPDQVDAIIAAVEARYIDSGHLLPA